MSLKLPSIFIILLLLFCKRGYTQQHSLNQYSVSEGLAQSEATKIHQDSLGYLWVATSGGGISKFDGVNFVNYNENNGLGGNIITDITEGNLNKLYFASTWGPVSIYQNGKIKTLSENEEGIQHLTFDKTTKTLFASKNKSLFYYKKNKWEAITSFNKKNIINFIPNSNGKIYYYTSTKIFELNSTNLKNKLIYSFETDISSIYLEKNGTFLIALKNKGLVKLENEQVYSLSDKLKNIQGIEITEVIKDLDKNLWVTTKENGIFKYKEDQVINITQNNGLPTNSINSIYCDRQNNIWIAATGEGILKYIKTPFINYSNVEGLNKANNFAILKDSEGNIWTGTSHNGCYVYNGKTVINHNITNNLPSNTVFSIIETPNKTIWIATRKGLVQFKNGKFNPINKENGLVGNSLNYLYNDSQNRIWVATNSGISIINNENITNYTLKNGLPNEQIHTVYEDSNGIIWLGTSDGLLKYYQGNFRKYGSIDGLCNSYVGSIIEDNNGVLWVGTDRCISKLVNEKFIPYTEKDGLNSTIVYLMNKDNNGNLWVGTNKGLDKITLNSESEIEKIEFFGKNEGFYGIENNTRGTFKDNEGNLYFATIKGIFKYQSEKSLLNEIDFPLYINSIKLFLNPIDSSYQYGKKNSFGISDSLILPANKNHITFEFTGLDLTTSTDVTYSYKLENFDSTWFEHTSSKYAIYSNLPPGEYVFKVKAQSKKSKSSPTFVSCFVKIEKALPPFYFRWWFILLGTILFISIVYNLVFLRNKALRISKEELEEKVKERTLEISKQNKEKTVLLQEIHHRVKNNLQIINSLFNIQAHYTSNDETKTLFKESQNRILSMAKIHQTLYESNDFSKLNLKTYITSLVNDIKESYSVNERVKLNLTIEENIHIDLDSLIPFALITNEIISNAFKYAFKFRDNNTILIDIKQTEKNFTTIKIEDNGVGLPEDFNWENPTSMGIDLIKTLTDQLEGTIDVKSNNRGTSYLLTFVSK